MAKTVNPIQIFQKKLTTAMQYSSIRKNDASGVPSLFASSGMSNKHKSDGASYLHKRGGKVRQKVDILALVDDAIEDGATDEAKQKAFAERAASEALVPQVKLKSPRRRSRSTPTPMNPLQRSKNGRDTTLDSEKDNNSIRSIRSLVHDSPKVSSITSPHTPAWKARLKKQGKEISNPLHSEKKPIDKTKSLTQPSPKSKGKSPKTGKRVLRKKSPVHSISLDLPFSRDEQPKELLLPRTQKSTNIHVAIDDFDKKEHDTGRSKKGKKEKKEKKKRKKKVKDDPPGLESVAGIKVYSATGSKVSVTKNGVGKVSYEESDSSFNNDDVIFRNDHQGPVKSDEIETKEGSSLCDKSVGNLRKKLDETHKQLENVARVSKQELSDLQKDVLAMKEAIRFRFMKDIHVQGKKNDVKYQAYKNVIDDKQKEIDDLRSANQRLRTAIQKIPKQTSEVIFSNQSLEEANEEVAGHIAGLEKFYKKLQTDQERLLHSNSKCKNEYLPRYRQQLWESRQHLDSETKIKNLYRDCIIKITKQIEKSRQSDLIENVSSMVLETEGEVNPKFDPKFLSTERFNSEDSLSSDSNDSDSSDSSSSCDSSYSEGS